MTTVDNTFYDLICIGGGAAGFFGAISCAELSAKPARILILEGTQRLLTKVKVSGGGRCNVTHFCFDPKALIQNYPRGGKNLLNGFYRFGPSEMIQWLKEKGVQVVAEADGRMFPNTNSSQTIIDCFVQAAESLKIEVRKGHLVRDVQPLSQGFAVVTKDGTYHANHVLLATGSMSYGHDLARSLGHNITPLAPSLFTLKSEHAIVPGLAGISVNVADVTLKIEKTVFKQKGPLLITHWGFSGPSILKLSAFAAREFLERDYSGELIVNWLPMRKRQDAWLRIKEVQQSEPHKMIINSKVFDIPKRLWSRFLELTDIENKVWNETSDKSLQKLLDNIVHGVYSFSGKGEFKEEFVTCGGVDLREVHLSSFESKIHSGLFFAGEVLDVDGITGGFNFQNAWTSSRMAAQTIASRL